MTTRPISETKPRENGGSCASCGSPARTKPIVRAMVIGTPIPAEVAKYQRWQRRRLAMKPGLTCLWQISGRNEVDFDRWMQLDLEYIDTWSPMLDLKILLKTVPVVLSGKGAS